MQMKYSITMASYLNFSSMSPSPGSSQLSGVHYMQFGLPACPAILAGHTHSSADRFPCTWRYMHNVCGWKFMKGQQCPYYRNHSCKQRQKKMTFAY